MRFSKLWNNSLNYEWLYSAKGANGWVTVIPLFLQQNT